MNLKLWSSIEEPRSSMWSAMARETPTRSMLATIMSVVITTTAHFILRYLEGVSCVYMLFG